MVTKYRNRAVLKIITALSMAVFLTACSQNREPAAAGPKGSDMQASKQVKHDGVSRPSIDLNAPAEFATATFGLG